MALALMRGSNKQIFAFRCGALCLCEFSGFGTLCSVRNLPSAASTRVIPIPSRIIGFRPTKVWRMANNTGDAIKSKPLIKTLQQFPDSDSTGGWEKRWELELTPWDLGQPIPIILHLHQTGALPKGRALVPGCGTGYDVVAIACPDRYAVGLDISYHAIKKAKELSSSSPNASYCTFIKEDFFTWCPTELFDLIIDYTFFCAIEPERRSAWAHRVQDLLKPDGELITLIFPISGHVGGPPYKVSVSDYEEVLHPLGFKATSIIDNEMAVRPRKGREKLGRWKRSLGQSLL